MLSPALSPHDAGQMGPCLGGGAVVRGGGGAHVWPSLGLFICSVALGRSLPLSVYLLICKMA